MSDTIRVFLGIEPSTALSNALAHLLDSLARAELPGLRLVRTEAIHLTLNFLGDTDREKIEAVVDSLSRVAQAHDPFELELGGPGVFPDRGSPRVLWAGVEGELPELAALQKESEDALTTLGFVRDTRPFSPHLTLGRFRDGTSLSDRRRAAETLFSTALPHGTSMRVSSLSLIRSRLLPDGAVYERLAALPLEGGIRNSSRG